jgi:hypothetical protein
MNLRMPQAALCYGQKMRFLGILGLGAASVLLLTSCTTPVEQSTEPVLNIDLEETVTVAEYREQLVPAISMRERTLALNSTLDFEVAFIAPGGSPEAAAWALIQVAKGLAIEAKPSPDWDCGAANAVGETNEILCLAEAQVVKAAVESGIALSLSSNDVSGLFGVAVQSGFGVRDSSSLSWEEVPDRSDASRTFVKVLSQTPTSQTTAVLTAGLETIITSQSLMGFPRLPGHVAELEAMPIPTAQQARFLPLTDSLGSFCLLYDAIGLSGGSFTAGPVEFSDLGNSSKSSGGCDGSSVITLSSADVSLGSVKFTDVTGSVTPSTITLNSKVANGSVTLTITGPYPDTGAEFTATAAWHVNGRPMVATGDVDYSQPNQVTITLGFSTSNIGWEPLPGFSLSGASSTGTFVRSGSGDSMTETFDLQMQFAGNWNPIGTVSAKSLSVDITNKSGDLVGVMSTEFQGDVSVSNIDLKLSGLKGTGSVDFDTGRTELDVQLEKLSIGGIAEVDSTMATFVYDPNESAGGSSVFISGSAKFEPNLSSFFAGDAIEATIEFSEAGYLLTAEMTTVPGAAAFEISSIQFVYTSLLDPTVPFEYEPKYPEFSGILIPLANEAPLAIAIAKGLPASFATALKDLDLNVIDSSANSIIAVELPPGVPKLSLYYQAPHQPYLTGTASSATYLRFDDIFLSIEAGETEAFTIGGDLTLHVSNTDLLLESALTISIGEMGAGIDGYLELVDQSGWNNAFGLTGLTVFDLIVQAGLDDGLISFGMEATASLPNNVTAPLGIIRGSVITLGFDFSATTPCAVFAINPPAATPNANVLSLDGGGLTAKSAEMIIAPDGCQLGQLSYNGYSMSFDGAIRGVGLGFQTTFEIEPAFTLQGSGYVDSFPMGQVTMEQATASLSIDSTGFSLSLAGGMDAGDSIKATGIAMFASNGGFTFDGEGKVFIGGNGSDVIIHATDCKDIACTELTDASFSVTGKIVVNGFEFDASLAADSKGDFTAKLSIPNHSHDFTFHNSNPKVSGKGTVKFTISVEVSNVNPGEIDFSGSVKLTSCTVQIVVPVNCSGAKVSWSDTIKTGSVDLSITIEFDGSNFHSRLTV